MPTWVDWAAPAICEILAEHSYTADQSTRRCACGFGGNEFEQADWREHVAPLIAQHLRDSAIVCGVITPDTEMFEVIARWTAGPDGDRRSFENPSASV